MGALYNMALGLRLISQSLPWGKPAPRQKNRLQRLCRLKPEAPSFLHPSTHDLSSYLSVYLPICQSIYLSLRASIRLFYAPYLSTCLSISPTCIQTPARRRLSKRFVTLLMTSVCTLEVLTSFLAARQPQR